MTLYLLLDTSGSMSGDKIGALNDCMENILAELNDMSEVYTELKLSIMTFAREVKWLTENLVQIADFSFEPLRANGMTSMGAACLQLAEQLKEIKDDEIYIFILSDGCPTDDYDDGINTLDSLRQFTTAHKYAIALGENADMASLVRFTGDNDHVIKTDRVEALLTTIHSAISRSYLVPPETLQSDEGDEWS